MWKVPDQTGKTFVVTGASDGLGLVTAKYLAQANATVVMVGRNQDKTQKALETVKVVAGPEAQLSIGIADLGSMKSLRAFAEALSVDKIDVLINNAGLGYGDKDTVTEEGIERIMGVNHFGTYALTGLLLSRLRAADGARIVNVSSMLANSGSKDLVKKMPRPSNFGMNQQYSDSKLANQLHMVHLNTLLKPEDEIVVVCAHPGFTLTNFVSETLGKRNVLLQAFVASAMALVCQSVEQGALPQTRAATQLDVRPNDYFGPAGFGGCVGQPVLLKHLTSRARDDDSAALAKELWARSAELTGIRYPGL